jgi:hypothetical protein
MLLELLSVLAVVGIPVVLFPILKKCNEAPALGFYSLRFIEAIRAVAHSQRTRFIGSSCPVCPN